MDQKEKQEVRKCGHCKNEKQIECFVGVNRKKLTKNCDTCRASNSKSKTNSLKKIQDSEESKEGKICTGCKHSKPFDDFIGARGGETSRCKNCRENDNNRHKIKKEKAKVEGNVCSNCFNSKSEDAFIDGNSGKKLLTCESCRQKDFIRKHQIDKEKEEAGLIICGTCREYKEPEYFYENEKEFKQCNGCRESDRIRNSDLEVKKAKSIKQKETPVPDRAYTKWRERKREEDLEGYLLNNAKSAKIWRDNDNLEHLSAWRKNNFKQRYNGIFGMAKMKGIPWHNNLTKEICKEMMSSSCYYCGHLSPEILNGIDRLDNQRCYILDNCVPCCKYCNFIKSALDPETFIERCCHISFVFDGKGELSPESWSDYQSASYNQYKYRAVVIKNIDFELSREQFQILTDSNCHYCWKKNDDFNKNGVDRKDNSLGYTMENVVPCCAECNYMKCDMGYQEFIDHCKKVSEYFFDNEIIFPKVEVCLRSFEPRGDLLMAEPDPNFVYKVKEIQERFKVLKIKK